MGACGDFHDVSAGMNLHLHVDGIALVDVDHKIGNNESGKASFRDCHLVLTGSDSREGELPCGVSHHLLNFICGDVGELSFGVWNNSSRRICHGSQNEARVGRLRPPRRRRKKCAQQDKRDRNALQDFHGASTRYVSGEMG